MIVQLPRSLRSLWSPGVVLVGLGFSLLGVAMVTVPPDPDQTRPTVISGLVVGAFCILLGLPFIWGGARMGVFRDGDGVQVREIFRGGQAYRPEEITGFSMREQEHHSVPLMVIQPVIVLANGSEVWITSLATYRVIPGARGQVHAAARRMSKWTGKPVLPVPTPDPEDAQRLPMPHSAREASPAGDPSRWGPEGPSAPESAPRSATCRLRD